MKDRLYGAAKHPILIEPAGGNQFAPENHHIHTAVTQVGIVLQILVGLLERNALYVKLFKQLRWVLDN